MNAKLIKRLSLLGAAMGLGGELLALINMMPSPVGYLFIRVFRVLSPQVHLSFYRNSLLNYHNFESSLELNFLNLAFFLLFFVGAILYATSKKREVRLLRFAYSGIFLFLAVHLLIRLYFLVFQFSAFFQADYSWLINLLDIASTVGWGYFAFIALRFLGRPLDTSGRDDEQNMLHAPKGQRLAHHLIDLFLSIFILSAFVMFAGQWIFRPAEQLLGERLALYGVVFICRMTYYTFFESIFGATPAKFLTESRVVMRNGEHISFSTALVRSLIRHVPFEAFSYLSEGNGWHDKWMDTKVVKEERCGVPAKRYLWILPAFLLIGILSWVGHEMYERYERYTYQKEQYELKNQRITRAIDNLSTNHVFAINKVQEWSRMNIIYLKVEHVEDEQVVMSVFESEEYAPTPWQIEQVYEAKKYNSRQVKLNRDDLYDCLTPDYQKYEDRERNGAPLLGDEEQYKIEDVFELHRPVIEDEGTGGYQSGVLTLRLNNIGWPATLTSVSTVKGELEWLGKIPRRVRTAKTSFQTTLYMQASGFERGEPYEFVFALKDTLDNGYFYKVSGKNLDRRLSPLDSEEYSALLDSLNKVAERE